jgi:hypothetical protein
MGDARLLLGFDSAYAYSPRIQHDSIAARTIRASGVKVQQTSAAGVMHLVWRIEDAEREY